jgi:hypothetical protein
MLVPERPPVAEEDPAMRRVVAVVRTSGRWVLRQVGRIVNDSPASTRPPGSNYLPNSNGEGGTVISSGNPGSH